MRKSYIVQMNYRPVYRHAEPAAHSPIKELSLARQIESTPGLRQHMTKVNPTNYVLLRRRAWLWRLCGLGLFLLFVLFTAQW